MATHKNKSIGFIILTFNAEKHIKNCLIPVIESDIATRIFVIDSRSDDKTVEISRSMGAEVISINKNEFNHGATREMARRIISTDIIVMLSQDAYAVNGSTFIKLVEPLIKGYSVSSYARQIPHKGATRLEIISRTYNYGENSEIRSINDIKKIGINTFFSSNSCAAYLNSTLDKVGGFRPTLSNEDYLITAKLLLAGDKIAYVSEALVYHSHNFGLVENFRRYFDAGYVRARNGWIQDLVGHADKRGIDYCIYLLKDLYNNDISIIPYAVIQLLCSYLGFKIGYHFLELPLSLKRILSSQKHYWESNYFTMENLW